jgi:hypothetical protein
MRKIARLNIAIGGLLIVTSLILVGLVLLIFLNLIDPVILTNAYISSFLSLMFITFGILDLVAVIILILDR